jgi:PIN domain nuclease of toxin-antitoxin system
VTAIAVLDTHALLWWMLGRADRLGRAARRFVEAVDRGAAVACVSTLSLLEVGEASRAGRVRLPMPFASLVSGLENTPGRYLVVPFTTPMALRAHELHAIPERADRLIAATALELGYPLVTRDSEIAAVIGAETLW